MTQAVDVLGVLLMVGGIIAVGLAALRGVGARKKVGSLGGRR